MVGLRVLKVNFPGATFDAESESGLRFYLRQRVQALHTIVENGHLRNENGHLPKIFLSVRRLLKVPKIAFSFSLSLYVFGGVESEKLGFSFEVDSQVTEIAKIHVFFTCKNGFSALALTTKVRWRNAVHHSMRLGILRRMMP